MSRRREPRSASSVDYWGRPAMLAGQDGSARTWQTPGADRLPRGGSLRQA
ncbi:hypothetical protein ABT187_11915 [Streptomyces sp. NPDC001817]